MSCVKADGDENDAANRAMTRHSKRPRPPSSGDTHGYTLIFFKTACVTSWKYASEVCDGGLDRWTDRWTDGAPDTRRSVTGCRRRARRCQTDHLPADCCSRLPGQVHVINCLDVFFFFPFFLFFLAAISLPRWTLS